MDAARSVYGNRAFRAHDFLQRSGGEARLDTPGFELDQGATFRAAESICTDTDRWFGIWWKSLRIKRLFHLRALFDAQKSSVVTSRVILAPKSESSSIQIIEELKDRTVPVTCCRCDFPQR
jgi:hypothetical protein